jgi:type I restriction enzyme R subunit
MFSDFINEPLTIVRQVQPKTAQSAFTISGTYPANDEDIRDFRCGFFDLIIADESHRSIYNRYRDF